MIYLKQSTASQEIPLGYFLDSTDGNTEETGLTIANTDIKLWKSGATTLSNKNSGGATHISNGIYYAVLDATDTDTLGSLVISVHVSGALTVRLECVVLSANIYDSWIAGTDNQEVDTVQISGDSTAADNLESTYDGTGYNDPVAPAQQQQVDNITIGSSGISTSSESAVLTTGSQVNTFAATKERDGTYHEISDDTGTTDIYYQFNVGAVGVPASVTIYGRSNGNNDSMNVFGYNWGATSWEQIGTITGKATAVDDEYNFSLYNTHVGSLADAGKVRVRFQNTGLTSATLYIDQLYVSYAIAQSPVGYANGSIWVDTINGTAGTVIGVNGTADNPVDSMADANTLAASTGLNIFYLMPGSSITFATSQEGQQFDGCNWTLALGGQSISGTIINCATISGIGTGINRPTFDRCHLGAITVPPCHMDNCSFDDTVTIGSAGNFTFANCHSGIAGTLAPVLDFGSSLNASNVNIRMYSGGIEIRNMGAGTGSYNMTLEGFGQLLINENCSATSTVAIRGHFIITDNASGAVTLSNLAMFDHNDIIDSILVDTGTSIPNQISALNDPSSAEITDAVWDEILTGASHNIATSAGRRLRELSSSIILTGTSPNTGGTANTLIRIELDSDASSINGAYDPAIVCIMAGTGSGQSRQIFEYDGANKYAYVNRDWKTIPDNTSSYAIMAHSGDGHTNEGLAVGGSNNTITLNPLADAVNDIYIGQVVVISAGVGQDQARRISDYDGITKIVTVERNWITNPTANSVYFITQLDAASNVDLSSILSLVSALNDISVADIIAGITDGSLDLQEMLRLITSACAGKSSGGGTPTLTFRDSADSKNRITATVDANGNRTGVTLDGS